VWRVGTCELRRNEKGLEILMTTAMPAATVGAEFSISDQEFRAIQGLVKDRTGIALTDHKRSLVVARLGKRLRTLGFATFRQYFEHVTGGEGDGELENFVNAITTNKTDFFRERTHFEFLSQEVIPALKRRALETGERRIRIWSAGCSTGEEAYTIALTLCEALGSLLTWDVRILASDIDTQVLAQASAGVYAAERAAEIPTPQLHQYFLKGSGEQAGQVKVGREIHALVTFRRINLLEEPWPIRATFDCIFCRNVIIYFDKPTQSRLMYRFAEVLREDGYLFLGHSESLHGICDRFSFLRNTVYRKNTEARAVKRPAAGEAA
jgi:chemotaxis protein methyltransferase CheR